jgi:hypothetical protein
MRKRQELPWAQLLMAANAPMMTRASMVDGKPEVGILPTGQVVGVLDELPGVAEVIEQIAREAEATLERLTSHRFARLGDGPREARPAAGATPPPAAEEREGS